jgi:hypothetical protein
MTPHEFVQWVSDGTGRSGVEVVAALGAAALTATAVALLRATDAVNEARIHHPGAGHATAVTGQERPTAPEATHPQ